MTLRKALFRGLLGIPIGVFISSTITLLISLFFLEEGVYHPVVPEFAKATGNQVTAVLLQYLLSGLMGFGYGSGSAVFEVENWSITKQAVIHFFIVTIVTFPIAFLCYWMEHTLWGVVSYILLFFAIYFIIWLIQMYFLRQKVEGINNSIKGK